MTQQTPNAGALLWENWQKRTRIDQLPPDCRPADRAAVCGADGNRRIRARTRRMEIAATSSAGQKHIAWMARLPDLCWRIAYSPTAQRYHCKGTS